MKKPFETNVAIKVTKNTLEETQKYLFAIGCSFPNYSTRLRTREDIDYICVSILGNLSCLINTNPVHWKVFSLLEVLDNACQLSVNQFASLKKKRKDIEESFLLTAERFGEDIQEIDAKLAIANEFAIKNQQKRPTPTEN